MDLSTQTIVLVSVLTLAGAVLGGAVGHWKRGGPYIATGAVIGGLSMFIFGFVATVYAGVIGAMALVIVVGFLAWNFLFG
ncbi:MAG TPA: hypothetical protein VF744_17730 [Beijerinckiaceae bacterium]|jgi:hypothetical protein